MPETEVVARTPEEITKLFVERANAGDAAGLAALYEEDAVLGFPPGAVTTGREGIRGVFAKMLAAAPRFELEEPLATLQHGDVALTSTRSRDGKGVRVQVVRRQPDGRWLRIIDRPEVLQ